MGRASIAGLSACLNCLGLGVGAAGLLSAVPGLGVLEVVVGLFQIVWFLWFGIVTARIGSAESHAVVG